MSRFDYIQYLDKELSQEVYRINDITDDPQERAQHFVETIKNDEYSLELAKDVHNDLVIVTHHGDVIPLDNFLVDPDNPEQNLDFNFEGYLRDAGNVENVVPEVQEKWAKEAIKNDFMSIYFENSEDLRQNLPEMVESFQHILDEKNIELSYDPNQGLTFILEDGQEIRFHDIINDRDMTGGMRQFHREIRNSDQELLARDDVIAEEKANTFAEKIESIIEQENLSTAQEDGELRQSLYNTARAEMFYGVISSSDTTYPPPTTQMPSEPTIDPSLGPSHEAEVSAGTIQGPDTDPVSQSPEIEVF